MAENKHTTEKAEKTNLRYPSQIVMEYSVQFLIQNWLQLWRFQLSTILSLIVVVLQLLIGSNQPSLDRIVT